MKNKNLIKEILDLNTDVRVSASVATALMDDINFIKSNKSSVGSLEPIEVGSLNNNKVILDPNMKWSDYNIRNIDGTVIKTLTNKPSF